MGLLSRLRRAVGASLGAFGAHRYRVRGEILACPVCGEDEFVRSTGSTYVKPVLRGFNLPWLKLDRHATMLICAHCTHMLTFGRTPEADERVE